MIAIQRDSEAAERVALAGDNDVALRAAQIRYPRATGRREGDGGDDRA